MKRRNRWHVYETLKQSYKLTGQVLSRQDIIREFGGDTEPLEIEEGIREFIIARRQMVPGLSMSQVINQ